MHSLPSAMPDINPRQFTAMTRLDHNRAKTQLAQKSALRRTSVKRPEENHSATQYGSPALTSDAPATADLDMDWYANEFIPTVQQRGAAIIEAREPPRLRQQPTQPSTTCEAGRWALPTMTGYRWA